MARGGLLRLIGVVVVVVVASRDGAQGFSFGEVLEYAKDYLGIGVAKGDVEMPVTRKTSGEDASTTEDMKMPRMVEYENGVKVVDYSHQGLPKMRWGHRVADVFDGENWDNFLQDAPDDIRPPSVVAFYDSSDAQCVNKYNSHNWDKVAETKMPSRARLFTARYDMYAAPRRAWYKFTPEMDLKARFNVTECPTFVFVPRRCNGRTEWCSRGQDPNDPNVELMGCEDFKDQCTGWKHWNGKGDLTEWILEQIKEDGEPKISPFLRTYKEQGVWLQKREQTTANTHFRNTYMTHAFPAFTERGFAAMETPKEIQDWMMDFLKRHEKTRRTEYWDGESTQLSFHERQTTFVDLDRVRNEKERVANQYIKPIVEKWSGVTPLELTSFYGIREYHEGAWLRNHVDRIDTHVLSVTFTLAKTNLTGNEKPWPLEVVDWNGDHVRYDHPAGTMVLYESSKLAHGRPYPNFSGVHVGAFMHFKPLQMHGKEAAKWDEITSKARANVQAHQTTAPYRQTPAVEPENPVFSEVSYGEGSKWTHLDEEEDDELEENASEMFTVKFKNDADRPMQLFWIEREGATPVFQGKAWKGAAFEINTYPNHLFYWAEIDSDEPAPGGRVQVDQGKRVYIYNINSDGVEGKKPSKWAQYVKDKIKEEEEMLEKAT